MPIDDDDDQREDTFSLDGGEQVCITWPEAINLTNDEYQELADWIEIVKSKIATAAKVTPAPPAASTPAPANGGSTAAPPAAATAGGTAAASGGPSTPPMPTPSTTGGAASS